MKFFTLTIFILVDIVCGISLQRRAADDSKGLHTCEYNGQTFKEGDALPTLHLCLECTCTPDFIEPSSTQCQVIQCPTTDHLERGCVPEYNSSDCCPVSWDCATAQSSSEKCDKRYFKHYEAKGCTPVYDKDPNCPVRFHCPTVDNAEENKNECRFEGNIYKKSEPIDIGNPCQICSCQRKFSEGLEIACIGIECPSAFSPPLNDSCYEVYDKDSCCPTSIKCSDGEETDETPEKVCVYDGKSYKLGEKIYPKEDPCLSCTCTEDWTGIHGNSCRVHNCALERKRAQLNNGCIPIYHEATCCPIEFFCGAPYEYVEERTGPPVTTEEIESGNTCVFKGVHYKLGEYLGIHHPTNCVTCRCSTPPDFTCIHRSCPRPPNDDYKNCRSIYTPGKCCATYECNPPSNVTMRRAPPRAVKCTPVKCPKGCSEVTVSNSCPFCQCDQRLCSTPKCPSGCQVITDVPAGQCPTCSCPDSIQIHDQCVQKDIVCPNWCKVASDPFGCPFCVCEGLCSPPKCGAGCEVERDVGKGECPRCSCPDDPEDKIQCSPVQCPAPCHVVKGDTGCPACLCEPQCTAPKCDPGCHVAPPSNPNECSKCVCGAQDYVPQLMCSPVKCGPLCREAFGPRGCPACICDPACAAPICDVGCRQEYDPRTGPCPRCVCDKVCPRVICGSMCTQVTGPDGCSSCHCGPLCTPPRCDAGCSLHYDGVGGCPACVCDHTVDNPDLAIQCSMPQCDDPCFIDYSTEPCPSCSCDGTVPTIQCTQPLCAVGCTIDYSTKPCPSCSCNKRVPSRIQCGTLNCPANCLIDYSIAPCPRCTCRSVLTQCSQPNCGPGCRIDYSTTPCPTCTCAPNPITPSLQCSIPRCQPGCRINYGAKPCPICVCPSLQCTPLNCSPGCRIDYSAKPCPRCVCDQVDLRGIPSIQCSPPNCQAIGCSIDYSTIPCPSCKCGLQGLSAIQCSPPKCDDPGCRIDYSTQPCPSCKCHTKDVSGIQCSTPKCDDPGCKLDYTSKPCPSCACLSPNPPVIACATPKCDAPGCTVDYNMKPCPGCSCVLVHDVKCSLPKCDPDCIIDYSAKPCPRCSCSDVSGIQCSTPKCDDPGCKLDYTSKPCPSCTCLSPNPPVIACATPKCDAPGCTVDYNMKPCPGCSCVLTIDDIQCSMPKCDPGCFIDYSTKPCPSCSCTGTPTIMCSMPKCISPCRLDYSEECPRCVCDADIYKVKPTLQCSPPKCDDYGCSIDYSTKPCPSCNCMGQDPPLQCSPPKCDNPECGIDYTAKPCPACVCVATDVPTIQCSPPKCDSPLCSIDYSTKPCPTCNCRGLETSVQCSPVTCGDGCVEVLEKDGCPSCRCQEPICSIPQCGLGCRIDYNADPCPVCLCDRYRKAYSAPQLYGSQDSACRQLTCGPRCEKDFSMKPGQNCPNCNCRMKQGGVIKNCASMMCQWPCRMRRFVEHACPICDCRILPTDEIEL